MLEKILGKLRDKRQILREQGRNSSRIDADIAKIEAELSKLAAEDPLPGTPAFPTPSAASRSASTAPSHAPSPSVSPSPTRRLEWSVSPVGGPDEACPARRAQAPAQPPAPLSAAKNLHYLVSKIASGSTPLKAGKPLDETPEALLELISATPSPLAPKSRARTRTPAGSGSSGPHPLSRQLFQVPP